MTVGTTYAAEWRDFSDPLTGRRVRQLTDSPAEDRIPDLLAEQLTHPIHWTRTLATLTNLGVTDYVTVGPGAVLRGLVRKCLGASTRVHGTEDAADRRRTLSALRGLTEER